MLLLRWYGYYSCYCFYSWYCLDRLVVTMTMLVLHPHQTILILLSTFLHYLFSQCNAIEAGLIYCCFDFDRCIFFYRPFYIWIDTICGSNIGVWCACFAWTGNRPTGNASVSRIAYRVQVLPIQLLTSTLLGPKCEPM
jgi:hypothetical protein